MTATDTGLCWLAEAPKFHGYYLRNVPLPRGKLGTTVELGTPSASEARRFSTREECAKFCAENPHPKWEPVEHLFYS